MEVYKEPKWVAWATSWLSGKERSAAADAADAAAAYAAATAKTLDLIQIAKKAHDWKDPCRQ